METKNQRNNGFIGEREGNMDKIVVDFGNIIEEMKNKADII